MDIDIDGQDWEQGQGAGGLDEGVASLDDDAAHLSLDGGDGDGDGDADSEDDEESECLGKLLESALENLVSKLDPASRNYIVEVIAGYALPSNPLDSSLYKPFYYLLVTRNKATGVPLYNTSALYNAASPAQQAQIQQSITNWDAIADSPTLWNDLAEGFDDDDISTEALKLDLALSFQFTRLVDNAMHTANDAFLHNWTPAGMAALVATLVGLATAGDYESPDEALPPLAQYMATYQAPSGLGSPPFALGAQALLLAYSVYRGFATLDQVNKCVGED